MNAKQVYDALRDKDWYEILCVYMDEKGVLDFIEKWYIDDRTLEDTFKDMVRAVCVETALRYNEVGMENLEKYLYDRKMEMYLRSYISGTPEMLKAIKDVHSAYVQFYHEENVRFR